MPPKTIGTWAVRWTQTVAPFPGQARRGPRGTSAAPRGRVPRHQEPSHEPADRDPAPQGPQGPDGHVRYWRELRPAGGILAREKSERRGPGPFAQRAQDRSGQEICGDSRGATGRQLRGAAHLLDELAAKGLAGEPA